MQLILLEKVANLGNLGDKVTLRPVTAVTTCCHSARPPLRPLPTWLRSKSVALSWKKQQQTRKHRLKAALPNWPSWK
jgi:hypothetical protein